MLDVIAQLAGLVADYIGHALGRLGWRFLIVSMLLIAAGCAFLLLRA